MRLHRLAFTAIGPFADTEVIDFTVFDDAGLFLLAGPTGAGKSMLIDAIVFALYGDVARQSDASTQRLRSDYASPRVHSEVDLIFETPAGIYRVTRTPKYVPKGNKSARNSQASLVRVIEDPSCPEGYRTIEGIERGARQISSEIKRIVGLTKEQFLQTVVLPQGKFAEFLTAKSEDRESILRDIFETGVYLDFQKRLVSEANSGKARLLTAEEECLRAFGALERLELKDIEVPAPLGTPSASLEAPSMSPEAPSLSPEAPSPEPEDHASLAPMDPLADEGWARERAEHIVSTAEKLLDQARASQPPLIEAAEKAAQALAQAKEDRALVEERTRLLEEKTALEAQSPAIAATRQKIEQARRVAAILPSLEQRDQALAARKAAHTQALHSLTACSAAQILTFDEASLSEELARSFLPQIENHKELRTEERARIRELLALEAGLQDRRHALEARVDKRAALEATIAHLDEQLAESPQRIAMGEEALEAMASEINGLEGVEGALERVKARMSAAQDALRLIEEMKAASQALGEAKAAARDAQITAMIAHEQWLNQTASALAQDLEEGQACPVCGSLEHPSPMPALEGEDLSRDAITLLDRAKTQADERFTAASSAHLALVEAVKEANGRAGGDAASISLELEEAQKAVERLFAVKKLKAELEADLKKAREKEAAVKEQRLAARVELVERRVEITSMRESLEADERRCAEAAGKAESLGDLDDALTRALTLLKEASSGLSEFLHCSQLAASAHERALSALDEGGFEDTPEAHDEIRSLHASEKQITALEAEVSAYDSTLGAVTQLLASSRLSRAEGLVPADEEPLREALNEAKKRQDEAQRRLGSLEQALKQIQSAEVDFSHSLSQLHEVRDSFGPLKRLAGIADASSKENLLQTPLSAWVLVSRLDEVLAAANPRLLSISSGRYELVSTPDDGTRSRRSGLGLAIVDHDTEETRSPRTLSGGESFYTSLSLALGLADVVTAEAGGIELRTMFIDEGFGSLDSATLELVMAELHELRDSGRVVGVISHVDEMARQIPDRITVTPSGRGGSRLSVTG
ncbi:ATP-dependent dsDNA exonuclease SbcC [Schaalia cardiffensis F0333]|uniref:Nuclease SbcCD subunit C n=1 Tax=Schaalia cardiffensis F0333 TaxID=888050 RepID=N6X5C4_9ACTO|nr:SMC family ATPase [Schaalia cardiffensis]ENO18941.1 ATP-dependent dsDNA exonuclease SbcC [Schaalia cardiffensis F0333]